MLYRWKGRLLWVASSIMVSPGYHAKSMRKGYAVFSEETEFCSLFQNELTEGFSTGAVMRKVVQMANGNDVLA